MHTDEQGFLAAIADRPADDAIRLIYADWLDEHDAAAQATFLRQECTWLATHPFTGPPSRPDASTLLKDVSQTAMTLDDGWLIQVSRTRWETHRLLLRFLASVLPTPPYDHRYGIVTTPDAQWTKTVRKARKKLERSKIGRKPTSAVCGLMPLDYWSFLTLVRSGLRVPQLQIACFTHVSGLTQMWSPDSVSVREAPAWKSPAEAVQRVLDGLWIRVAESSSSVFYVGVDASIAYWGQVLEIAASTPTFTYPTFSSCFADQVQMAEGGGQR